MLNIHDTFKKHKLFNFLDCLKPWEQQELYQRNVTNLVEGIVTAEKLTDFVSFKDSGKKK